MADVRLKTILVLLVLSLYVRAAKYQAEIEDNDFADFEEFDDEEFDRSYPAGEEPESADGVQEGAPPPQQQPSQSPPPDDDQDGLVEVGGPPLSRAARCGAVQCRPPSYYVFHGLRLMLMVAYGILSLNARRSQFMRNYMMQLIIFLCVFLGMYGLNKRREQENKRYSAYFHKLSGQATGWWKENFIFILP